MIIEGHCRTHGGVYDAHWNNYPSEVKNIINPYCLICKSPDVWTTTDEDYPEWNNDIYDEEE